MKLQKFFIMTMVMSVLLTACSAKPTPDPDGIIGSYHIKGSKPDKSTYEGTLDVTAKGEAFDWSWNDGEYKGVGLQEDDIVSVAWGDKDCFLVVYVVGEDGVLTGPWTDMSISGIGDVVATPVDKAIMNDLEGIYKEVGTEFDGNEVSCTLQITKKSEGVYKLDEWGCGEYTGVGIQNGNQLSVAMISGSPECSVMSYKVNSDGSMDGIWTNVVQSEVGIENAKPK